MSKTIIGIILFLLQISLAIFFNQTIDLIVVAIVAVIIFGVILFNNSKNKYNAS